MFPTISLSRQLVQQKNFFGHLRLSPIAANRNAYIPWSTNTIRAATTTVSAIDQMKELPPKMANSPLSYKSQWKRTTDVPLTRENFLDLLNGKTPTIREPGFLSPETSRKFEEELSPRLTPYKHNTGPLLTKVGVAQFEYQAQAAKDFENRANGSTLYSLIIAASWANNVAEKEQYFLEASKWRNLHETVAARTGVNAWAKVFAKITSLVAEWDVEIASEGPDKRYYSGVYRALNDATHVHCDWSPYDSLTEDWILNKVENQVVFNLYLAPVKGGRTTVHDVHWTKDVLKFRDPESYGYSRELVAGSRKAYVEPNPGSLCFFNSRNMHEVDKVDVEPMAELGLAYRPRLTLSSFMGLLTSEVTGGRPKLIFWS